jgi:curli biogenesis system outer membrane secretion channel CsgG
MIRRIAASLIILGVITAGVQAEEGKGAGNLRYTITVAKFKNEANWRGKWEIGDAFTTMMTDALQQSGHFIVLGDSEMRGAAMAEQDFAASGRVAGGKKAPKIGRMTPAQLLVRGSITHVESSAEGGGGRIRIRGLSLGGKGSKGQVNITMYLVDSETGQVKATTKVVGESTKRGLSLGFAAPPLPGIGGVGGDINTFKKDNVGKACENAIAQGVEFLVKQLEDIQWEGSIVLAKPGKLIINRGTREGVMVGHVFAAGEVEELVDPDTGEVLDSEMTMVGTMKVTQVKEKIAYCEALSGEDKLAKGMTVFPSQ